jgi:hypothetical protein
MRRSDGSSKSANVAANERRLAARRRGGLGAPFVRGCRGRGQAIERWDVRAKAPCTPRGRRSTAWWSAAWSWCSTWWVKSRTSRRRAEPEQRPTRASLAITSGGASACPAPSRPSGASAAGPRCFPNARRHPRPSRRRSSQQASDHPRPRRIRDRTVRPVDKDPDRRSGRGPARWRTGCPCLYPPFPASCPCRVRHRSVSGPRHIEPDRPISGIRLTAKASSIGVMNPFDRCALSRPRIGGGSPRRGPTSRTRWRYSTASSRIPCACSFSPRIASPCVRLGI